MRRHPSIARMLDAAVQPCPPRLVRQVMPAGLRPSRAAALLGVVLALACGPVVGIEARCSEARRGADVEVVGRMMLGLLAELREPARHR